MKGAPRTAVEFLETRVRALRKAVVMDLEDLNRLIAHILRGGVLLSVGILLAGLAIAALEGGTYPATVVEPDRILGPLLRLRPDALLSAGILVLISTPVVRVAMSVGTYLKGRDWVYAGITGIVLVNLLTALALSIV